MTECILPLSKFTLQRWAWVWFDAAKPTLCQQKVGILYLGPLRIDTFTIDENCSYWDKVKLSEMLWFLVLICVLIVVGLTIEIGIDN